MSDANPPSKIVTRRGVVAAATVIASTPALAAGPQPLDPKSIKKETAVACAYHCDFGDAQRFNQMLRNINNHLSVYDFNPLDAKIVIVAHAAGLKFFLNDRSGTPWEKDQIDPELAKRFDALAKYEVEAYLCAITFKNFNIPFEKARTGKGFRLVPSGVAMVAELQGKGFAYIKVG